MDEKMPLLVPVIWFFVAATWMVALFVDFYYKSTPGWLVVLHGVTAAVSLLAAIVNYVRYRKQRDSVSEK